jgi:hypothetical protein
MVLVVGTLYDEGGLLERLSISWFVVLLINDDEKEVSDSMNVPFCRLS